MKWLRDCSLQEVAKALAWLLLLVIFTYTPVLYALFLKESCLWTEYFTLQGGAFALFVNIGVLGMVMIDFFSVRPSLDASEAVLVFASIFFVFIIYFHSSMVLNGEVAVYKPIINNRWLSPVAHLCFLLIVWYFKFLSIRKPKDRPSIIATPIS